MTGNTAIRTLISRNMQTNRTRNLVAIIAIALTTVMFTSVFTVGASMLYSASLVGAGSAAGAQGMMAVLAILAMIFGSGYLIIYNIFQISVTRDIQLYGRLKTLGATQNQIRRMVFTQALRLCLIGIPAGLVIGFGVGAVLIPIILVSLGTAATLSLSPVIFLGAAAFSLATVMLSCTKPAKIAGQVAPVATMKYTDSDVSPKKKSKKAIGALTPQKMARGNMTRNVKRTVLVMVSIAVGLALMNSFFVYQHSFDEDAYVDSFLQSDIAVMDGPRNTALTDQVPEGTITPEMLAAMAQTPGVTQSGGVWYTEFTETINPEVLGRITAYYDEKDSGQQGWIEGDEDALRQYRELKQTGAATVSVYGMDAYTAGMGDVYVGSFDAERFATGRYVIAYGIAGNGEGSVHYEVGDIIEIRGQPYELMAMIDPASTVVGDLHTDRNKMEIDYVISREKFLESFPQTNAVSAFLDTENDGVRNTVVAALSEQYPELAVKTRLTYEGQFQSQTLAITAMGYTLGLIMALIGILNFANTMLTAIIARRHEFTMLESIGMTKRQLKAMLVSEGIYYVGISLVLSIIGAVFIAATYVQNAVSTSWVASYNFTLLPFAVIIPILVTISIAIPIVCFRGAQKESLVERLRSA